MLGGKKVQLHTSGRLRWASEFINRHDLYSDIFLVCNLVSSDGTPLQYCCLENAMDGEAWWAAVHGVGKSQTWLSDFTFTLPFHALEKEMATHSSVLAWRIPGTEEPGGLPSVGSHRVGHDWSDLAAAAAAAALLSAKYSSYSIISLSTKC